MSLGTNKGVICCGNPLSPIHKEDSRFYQLLKTYGLEVCLSKNFSFQNFLNNCRMFGNNRELSEISQIIEEHSRTLSNFVECLGPFEDVFVSVGLPSGGDI